MIPEAIGQDDRGYLSLSDRPILAASINAIKELSDGSDELRLDFEAAIEQANGDIDLLKSDFATQGLQLEQISTTLADYANQLADHEARIEQLEADIEALKQSQ